MPNPMESTSPYSRPPLPEWASAEELATIRRVWREGKTCPEMCQATREMCSMPIGHDGPHWGRIVPPLVPLSETEFESIAHDTYIGMRGDSMLQREVEFQAMASAAANAAPQQSEHHRFHYDPEFRARWENYRRAAGMSKKGDDPFRVDLIVKVADAEIASRTALLEARLADIVEVLDDAPDGVLVDDGPNEAREILSEIVQILGCPL